MLEFRLKHFFFTLLLIPVTFLNSLYFFQLQTPLIGLIDSIFPVPWKITVIILSFSHLPPHYSPSFHSLSPSRLHLSFILYKQHNFQTATLAVQDMKAYGGGEVTAAVVLKLQHWMEANDQP